MNRAPKADFAKAKKMELVMKDQQVKTFDFSVFSDEEIKQLLNATGKIKSRINQ